jgi:ParB-like chromosome segregation protein Spo0J
VREIMELKIEYVPIDSLKKYANNAKIHTEKQIQQIADSMQAFGFNDPIGIWNNEIVEGHGRLDAARLLKLETVPIIRLDHMSNKERKAYILAHNKLTMNTGFDEELLKLEFEELKLEDIDLNLTGFENWEFEEKEDINLDDFFEESEPKEKIEKTFICEHCGKESKII